MIGCAKSICSETTGKLGPSIHWAYADTKSSPHSEFGASIIISPYFNTSSVHPWPWLNVMVHCVTVTKTGSGAIVVSAKMEGKNGISVQNTNQLAGNHTFIILLTLISFQGKCPRSSYSLLRCLLALAPFSGLSNDYTLSVSDTNSIALKWHDSDTSNLPQQMTAAMSDLASGHRDHGGKMWSILSWQMLKCDCGVERLFIDRINKLLDAWREGGVN